MKQKKKHGKLKIFIIVIAVIALFFAVINIIPPKKSIENNPFIVEKGGLPMIAAHRGGSKSNPQNTLLAFREAVYSIGADIIESDLYLTKDGYLVYNHDSYIDKTCNVNGDISLDEVKKLCEDRANRHYIEDMTLEELRQYNFGYYFEDENGVRIYKDETDLEGKGLQMATADQLFEVVPARRAARVLVVVRQPASRERVVDLLVQLFPVGQDQESVVPAQLAPDLPGEIDHRVALARALCVPKYSELSV